MCSHTAESVDRRAKGNVGDGLLRERERLECALFEEKLTSTAFLGRKQVKAFTHRVRNEQMTRKCKLINISDQNYSHQQKHGFATETSHCRGWMLSP